MPPGRLAPGPSLQSRWHRLPSFVAHAPDMGAGGATVRTAPARARRLRKAWLNRVATTRMRATPPMSQPQPFRRARHTAGPATSLCNAFMRMRVEKQIQLQLSSNSSDAQFNDR
jgi:hypothetical protein